MIAVEAYTARLGRVLLWHCNVPIGLEDFGLCAYV